MVTPASEDPQPRDIALEQPSPELSAELEKASEPEESDEQPPPGPRTG